MELHPSDEARETVRLLVGPLPPDSVPAGLRRWLERPQWSGEEPGGSGGQPGGSGLQPEDSPGLGLEEVRWLRQRLVAGGEAEPLRALLKGGRMELPAPVTQARNPELEARCQRLRAEQEERSYRRMVRNVDSHRFQEPSLQIGKQMREVNAQLVEVGQVVFSVGAAFLFGYMATAVAAGTASTATRILAGLAAALVVLVAEGYFLLKYLSYMDEPGPVKAAGRAAEVAAVGGGDVGKPVPLAVKKEN